MPLVSAPIAPSELRGSATQLEHQQLKQPQTQPPPLQPPQWVSVTELLSTGASPEFALYKLNQGYSKIAVALCVMQTITFSQAAFLISVDGVPDIYKASVYVRAFGPVLGWMYFYHFRRYVPSDVLTAEGKRIILLGNLIILLLAISLGAQLLVWVITRDDCYANICMQDYPKHIIPLRLLIRIIVASIGMPIFYSCHDASVAILSIFISMTTLFVSAMLLHAPTIDMISISFMSIVMVLMLASWEGSLYSTFVSYSKFESALRVKVSCENKEYLMKIQTDEMCHMIGMYNIQNLNYYYHYHYAMYDFVICDIQ